MINMNKIIIETYFYTLNQTHTFLFSHSVRSLLMAGFIIWVREIKTLKNESVQEIN